MNKLIAVDIDNVLCATTATWFPVFCRDYGLEATIEDIKEYKPKELLGIEYQTVFDHLISFCHKNTASFTALHQDVINKLAVNNTLIALTDRAGELENVTKKWLKHYGNVFVEIIHTPVIGMSKGDFCAKRKVDILIEDAPENILASAQNGTLVLMVSMPWNKDIKETNKIKRINCLSEVENHLREWGMKKLVTVYGSKDKDLFWFCPNCQSCNKNKAPGLKNKDQIKCENCRQIFEAKKFQ